MKKILLVCAVLFPVLSFFAQSTETEQEQTSLSLWSSKNDALQWRGYFLSDNRLGTDDKNINWQEQRLSLSPEYKTGKSRFYAELWARSIGFPQVSNYRALSSNPKSDPIRFDLREVYFDVYDFLIPQLDLRVGRQRHAWGSADKLNPTDNLNPYDLEDMWDFGRHLSSNSIKLTYYVKDLSVSGVFIPHHTPLNAPGESIMSAFMPEINFPGSINNNNNILYLNYGNIFDTLLLPERHIKNAVYGLRIEKPFGNFNTSISYMRGFDALPGPFETTINPISFQADTLNIDISTRLMFSKTQIAGFDIAGSIFNVGVWAEAALFFPEKLTNTTSMTLMGIPIMEEDSVVIDDNPYIKYVAGIDYTFKNGVYLNIQYLYGFFHERKNDLNNYIIIASDVPLFRNKAKISPVNSSLQINDYKNIKNSYGLVYMPEITYTGTDNLQVSLGSRIIYGTENTLFGRMKNQSHIFVRFRYAF